MPVRPSARASALVISTSPPVARTKLEGRLDLRPHRAGGEVVEDRAVAFGVELVDPLGGVGAEAAVDPVHLGDDEELRRVEPRGQECRGEILVDHRVHAVMAVLPGDDRDAAAADRADRRAGGDEGVDALELEDLERLRRGDDPAPAAARVLLQHPAAVLFELLRLLLVVERPDGLGRVLEGGIVLGHADAGEEDGDGTVGDLRQLGRDERADLGLGLRDRDVERQLRRLLRGELLAQQLVSDLRPVSVRDHDGPGPQDRLEGRERVGEVGALLGRGAALALAQERVPAERDHRQTGAGFRHPDRFRSRNALPSG